jgi:hypothetical protein
MLSVMNVMKRKMVLPSQQIELEEVEKRKRIEAKKMGVENSPCVNSIAASD